MEPNENGFARSTHLPQPSRLASPKKLSELSASANNARHTSMLPPPTAGFKRKTLAERAGDPPRPPPATRSGNAIKPTSIGNISRPTSLASSMSSRPTSSASYRHGSSSSFGTSMSHSRAPSAQSFRPHSSMSGHSKSKSMYGHARPASSFDGQRDETRNGQVEDPTNSMTRTFSSARKCSANTSRRKVPGTGSICRADVRSIWPELAENAASNVSPARSRRDVSLTTAMSSLKLDSSSVAQSPISPKKEDGLGLPTTPSRIVKKKSSVSLLRSGASPTKTYKRSPQKTPFLTKDSNYRSADWDLGSRVQNMESMYADLKATLTSSTAESDGLKDSIALYKARVSELEDVKAQLMRENANLQRDLIDMRSELSRSAQELEDSRRKYAQETSLSTQAIEEMRRTLTIEIDDLQRQHRRDIDQAKQDADEEIRRVNRVHKDEIADLEKRLENAIEDEKERRRREVLALTSEGQLEKQKIESALEGKSRELQALRQEIEQAKAETAHEKDVSRDLKAKLGEAANNTISLEGSMRSLRARIDFLESDCKSQSQAFADLEQRTQDAIRESEEAKAKLRAEETLRRKLHNQVQELKGNIRVFCRIRPALANEEEDRARISFPDASEDAKEIEVLGQEEKSSLGTITTKKHPFAFDRVFDPSTQNEAVFEEISQLVQSALDGYNVCIFCYGQTGSGKTYTMSSEDGMIPRAVNQIYETAQTLREKGWTYTMEGSFVEVYNENINDLLGKAEDFDKKKHEVRHDMQRCKTTITDVTTVNLDSPGKVDSILRKAMNNRSVAATKANERSSRSHSVFILKLTGENGITGEKSEGTLNLVDLAGSERLSHSGATGERLKETQNINKSLSCLGDVIGALGQVKEGAHIPYRNSKLTYLLQFSLGGNSKTLMFVMISPLQAHLSETLTSLKFATKVHSTHIGTAKRQAKIKE